MKENSDLEEFDRIVSYKEKLIREIQVLDGGFEKLYERIKDDLLAEKKQYASEIKKMQSLIEDVTELSVAIQASEQRNKQLVEQYFSYTRGKIRQAKKSVKVASEYYKSMNRMNYVDSALLDKKK